MKISLNWLMDYIPLTIEREDLLHHLTDIGLEVGGTENWESVPGGMEGIVIGKVTACEQHSNADKLKVTRVNVGADEELPIVCGAPNVAEGQTVVVATVGTKLTMNGESLVIKKAKLRGEASHGMICAEDEIGLGESHAGIMVLPDDIKVGTPASEYFKIERDLSIEIDLTPNRIDAASHLGVARDLAARLSFEGIPTEVTRPDVSAFKADNQDLVIPVEIKNPEACKRYTSCTISGVKVEASPQWLQNRLRAIGLSPINNIVDITNYVLHETGHPMHAFDADKIVGNKVAVEKRKQGEKFLALDELEYELHADDLMICNSEKSMCIAGVFGGIDSGVKAETTKVFLESAWFDPVHVRKTARRHGMNTDASFRYERGADPEITVYALKRAALLIKTIAGGSISSDISDVYPEKLLPFSVDISYDYINRLLGEEISKNDIRFILDKLDIKIAKETETELSLSVPRYRNDVQRAADVCEEILRIYGYNRIPVAKKVNASINIAKEDSNERLMQSSSDFLSARGFHEIMSNSLSNLAYYEKLSEEVNPESIVHLANPGSSELSIMRRELIFGGLESIARNINHKQSDLKLYEYGKIYFKAGERDEAHPVNNHFEEKRLGIWLSGDFDAANWAQTGSKSDFYRLKSTLSAFLDAYGIDISSLKLNTLDSKLFDFGLEYKLKKQSLVRFGLVSKAIRKQIDIEQEVWYAEFRVDVLKTAIDKVKNRFKPLAKFPAVHRDLALLLDKSIRFEDLQQTAMQAERKYLKSMDLFDVYEGDGIEAEKKSYAVSFVLQDEEKTMNDKQIDKIMQKLLKSFEKDFDAKLR
ncbi:MAG: phenylalanine--tRNA ligase subunit beta [Bacteroidales bacterium]|jgi:phenylalanyl-tRNA synthetase beta chain|nr:phenylalanine--tRNA ligase subunit beta [Bacteroidales bacterium]